MRTRRNRFAAILLAVSTASPLAVSPTGGSRADACGLTDWLYGRNASGYSSYYAPAYGPLASSTTQLPIAPATINPATLNAAPSTAYRPLLAPATTNFWGTTGPAPTVTAMRPAQTATVQSFNNPSVYTGMPAGYGAPVSGALTGNPLRGVSPATNFGASKLYPTSTYAASGYAANRYAAGGQSYSAGYGSTALTVPAQPMAPPAAPVGGLRRFFGSLFGTNYRTSTYNAPVTYYRPAVTLDPVTGTTVTTQRACTGFETMVQRTPISGLQPLGNVPAGAVPVGPPVLVGDSGVCTTSAMGAYGASAMDGYGSVAQAGAMMPMTTPNYGASTSPLVPISPRSNLSSQLQPAPTYNDGYAPLTQSPAGNSGYQAGDDYTPLDAPELTPQSSYGLSNESAYGAGRQSEFRPSFDQRDTVTGPDRNESASEYRRRLEDELRRLDQESAAADPEPAGSYWTLPRDKDTSAMLPNRRESDYGDTMARYRSLEALTPTSAPAEAAMPSTDLRYRAEPIRGLESESRKVPSTDPQPNPRDSYRTLVAPPLAAARRTESARGVEAREIGLVRYEEDRLPPATRIESRSQRPAPQPKPVQRDSSWKPVR